MYKSSKEMVYTDLLDCNTEFFFFFPTSGIFFSAMAK